MTGNKSVVYFNKVQINPIYGDVVYNIYAVAEDDNSVVMEEFVMLESDTQEKIIALISNMATHKNFKSPQIKYHLKSYQYGEIRPKPHRFFFFQKCGDNYIFFDYVLKKENSLSDKIYKAIDKKRERYEKEFEEYIKKIQ